MAEGGIGYTESESGSVHRPSSLYSRHSRNHVDSVSAEISNIMNRLGYSEEMRRWRVQKYSNGITRVFEASNLMTTHVLSGSKAEGLTSFFESDIDLLYVLKSVLCVEAGINLHTIPDVVDIFRMDTRVYPGYCTLIHERSGHISYRNIQRALCDNGYGNVLLSSSLFLDEWSAIHPRDTYSSRVVISERAGPSIPATVDGILNMDIVCALRCNCPSILQRWAARPRRWPSPVIVQKIVSLGAYLTPTGFKGSEFKHMEWRICFNTGETELVNNLNDTQAKVYVILKMILKDIMKPKNKEITSYVLKNIILWQAENTPQTELHAHSLLHLLHDGLRELRTAIEKKQQRYYMIPERNLMAACGLEDALQHKWVADITDMLEEGPMVVLRLQKIRKAIVASPEPMLWFSKRRMEFEMMFLEIYKNALRWTPQNGVWNLSDFRLNPMATRMQFILLEVVMRMIQEGSSVNDPFMIMEHLLNGY